MLSGKSCRIGAFRILRAQNAFEPSRRLSRSWNGYFSTRFRKIKESHRGPSCLRPTLPSEERITGTLLRVLSYVFRALLCLWNMSTIYFFEAVFLGIFGG